MARETEVGESDPNADSNEGLAGEMGISSERTGPVRGGGGEPVTYGANDIHVTPEGAEDADDAGVSGEAEAEPLPEQSADPATGEGVPDNDLPPHEFDPETAERHSHG